VKRGELRGSIKVRLFAVSTWLPFERIKTPVGGAGLHINRFRGGKEKLLFTQIKTPVPGSPSKGGGIFRRQGEQMNSLEKKKKQHSLPKEMPIGEEKIISTG